MKAMEKETAKLDKKYREQKKFSKALEDSILKKEEEITTLKKEKQ